MDKTEQETYTVARLYPMNVAPDVLSKDGCSEYYADLRHKLMQKETIGQAKWIISSGRQALLDKRLSLNSPKPVYIWDSVINTCL